VREKWPTIAVATAAGLVLLTYLVVFQVRVNETAVHRRGGSVLRAINAADKDEAGWYFKLPWPVDTVTKYDKRLHVLDGKLTETELSDNRHVIISMYAGWQISDPVEFEKTLGGDMKTAEKKLKDIIFDATSQAVGKVSLDNLVSTDSSKLKFDDIEKEITTTVRSATEASGYGVGICSFGIRRIAIPEETTKEVFKRMRRERGVHAEQYRAEGNRIKTEIIEKARSESEQIIADAMAEAKRIRGEGEAEEAKFFETFAKAPDLAIYLRRLESLTKIADAARENGQPITFVIDTKTEPFTVLQGEPTQGQYATTPSAHEADVAALLRQLREIARQALKNGQSPPSGIGTGGQPLDALKRGKDESASSEQLDPGVAPEGPAKE